MSIMPRELSREELANVLTSIEAFIGVKARRFVEEHLAALRQEEEHLHRLTHRQGKLLTGVVNAIRGEPDELTLWSHHDAPELAKRAMTVVRAACDLLGATNEFGTDPHSLAEGFQTMGDAVHALEQHLGGDQNLATPGVTLPGWQETFRKSEAGVPLNPIEILICRLTPGDDARAQDFRRMLRAALDFAAAQPRNDER